MINSVFEGRELLKDESLQKNLNAYISMYDNMSMTMITHASKTLDCLNLFQDTERMEIIKNLFHFPSVSSIQKLYVPPASKGNEIPTDMIPTHMQPLMRLVDTANKSTWAICQAIKKRSHFEHIEAVPNKRIKSKNVKIVHVISPYKVKTCHTQFCPFAQEQYLAIGSMQRAREKSRGPVVLAATALPDDLDAIPSNFERLPFLTRSTASKYKTKQEFPFIQDIFDSLKKSDIE